MALILPDTDLAEASKQQKDAPVVITTDYVAQRAEAGARYAAACLELRDAMIDLAALDSLAQPSAPAVTGDEARAFTFAANSLADALPDLRHREFMPSPPKGLRASRRARRMALEALVSGGAPRRSQ